MKTYIGTTRQIYKEFTEDNKTGQYDLKKKYICEIKEFKGGKTDEQRALYWATLREYSKLLQRSGVKINDDMLHKIQLEELSILKTDSNGDFSFKLLKPNTDFKTYKDCHIKPTDSIVKDKNGNYMRVFVELKSSEDFTTEEYSRLIENLQNNIIQDGLDNEIDVNFVRG